MAKRKAVKTRVTTATCTGCAKEIYSRARHDFRKCECPLQTFVDGGLDYMRCGSTQGLPIIRYRFINRTKAEIYDDWNHSTDLLGVIG
jgi:hypothetical protein